MEKIEVVFWCGGVWFFGFVLRVHCAQIWVETEYCFAGFTGTL